jgi:uncharacterized protein (TIGR03435 family)
MIQQLEETEVWILAKTEVKPVALVEPAGTADLANVGWFPAIPPSVGRSAKLTYSTVSDIAMFMEAAVGKPVLDETGIMGKYDFHLTHDKADPQGSIEAMRRVGFKVESARSMIEFLVVTRVE